MHIGGPYDFKVDGNPPPGYYNIFPADPHIYPRNDRSVAFVEESTVDMLASPNRDNNKTIAVLYGKGERRSQERRRPSEAKLDTPSPKRMKAAKSAKLIGDQANRVRDRSLEESGQDAQTSLIISGGGGVDTS